MRRRGRQAELEARLARLEQRVDDVEDSVDMALAPDLLDDLTQRVGELSLTVPTPEDLLDLRLQTARVATELAHLAAEVRASIGRLDAESSEDLATVQAELDALHQTVASLAEHVPTAPRTLLRKV